MGLIVNTECCSSCLRHKSTNLSTIRNHVRCLRCLHENGCSWYTDVTWNAAIRGNLECLKYAHKNGAPWVYMTFRGATHGGNLQCLKYVHENGYSWDQNTAVSVLMSGNLQCIQYVRKDGCQWDHEVLVDAARYYIMRHLRYMYEQMIYRLAHINQWTGMLDLLKCLSYILNTENLCTKSDISGTNRQQSESLKLLIADASVLDSHTLSTKTEPARWHMFLECLRYLYDTGYSWRNKYCPILFDNCMFLECTNCAKMANGRDETFTALVKLCLCCVDVAQVICDFV